MVRSRRGVLLTVATVGLPLLALVLLIRLAALERGGPAHEDVFIGNGIPGTLYVPGHDGEDFPFQSPRGERPPLVVIAHGYSADQKIMSTMARSLARSGFATLTFDFRGHGANTHRFQGNLNDDLRSVLDWAETSPLVDGSRIAILGHSMGAGAVLDFGTLDPRPLAVIPISGGAIVNDKVTPKHLLLLVAERDPDRIHDFQTDVARELSGRTDVKAAEIGGTDHITVLWSSKTVDAIVDFLNPVFGTNLKSVGVDDPRLRVTVLYLLVFLGLVALLGLAVGRFVTPVESAATGGSLWLLLAALLVVMPLMGTGGPTFLPIGPGQPLVISLGLAGALLWGLRLFAAKGLVTGRTAAWIGPSTQPWLPLRAVVTPGLTAGLVLFLLLLPLGLVFHRMVPTAERAVYWAIVAALGLPFFAAFEVIVRRGSTWRAIGLGVLGRVILFATLVLGIALTVLPPVLGLVLPLLVFQFIVIEVFAATCYASGRNPAVIAVMEAVFIGWIAAVLTPIS